MDDLLPGLVVAVSSLPVGTQTAAAAAAGDVTLLLDDAVDLRPTGGQVTINGVVTDYASSDDDTSTILLAVPLAAALDVGSTVQPYPQRVDVTAMVLVDGASEPIPATVPWNMQDALPAGVREEEDREKVTLTRDGEWSWAVYNLDGQPLERNSAFIATPYLSAFRSTNLTLTTGVWTTVTGLTINENLGVVGLGSGVFQITADGLYDFRNAARFANNSTNSRGIRMAYTSNGVVTNSRWRYAPATVGDTTQIETAQYQRMVAGDTVEYQAFQNSGGDLTLESISVSALRVTP